MGTKDYDSSFCRGLVFCTQFKTTFALSMLTYPQKQQSQTGVCRTCVCPQLIIPSGKSILLLGIFMPFGAAKGGQSHENNQYWNSCPCRRWKDDLDGEPAICPVSYTHLDVYKRQGYGGPGRERKAENHRDAYSIQRGNCSDRHRLSG